MSKRKSQGQLPPTTPKGVDLSNVATDTSGTAASRVSSADSTKGQGGGKIHDISVDQYSGETGYVGKFKDLTWKDLLHVVALVVATVAVVWFAYGTKSGVDDVEQKVNSVSTTVSEISNTTERIEVRLENVEESVSDVRREVSSTKDAVNELRIESANRRDEGDDE